MPNELLQHNGPLNSSDLLDGSDEATEIIIKKLFSFPLLSLVFSLNGTRKDLRFEKRRKMQVHYESLDLLRPDIDDYCVPIRFVQ
jgi:hypothetical protein